MPRSWSEFSSALFFEKSQVEIFVATTYTIKTEVFFHEAAGVVALLLAKMGVGEKTVDCIRKVVFILCGNEHPALVVDQLGVASYVVGDHGQAGGHGFEDGVGKAFRIGGEDGHVHGGEDGGDVAAIAEEDGAVAEAECGSLSLEFRTKRAIAGEQEFHVRHALMNLGGDAEKAGVILIVRVHARDHAHAECIGAAGQRGRCGFKSRGGQGVSDDGEFLARHTGSSESIGGGLRVAGDRVAPAKSGGLRAELCQESASLRAGDDCRL